MFEKKITSLDIDDYSFPIRNQKLRSIFVIFIIGQLTFSRITLNFYVILV